MGGESSANGARALASILVASVMLAIVLAAAPTASGTPDSSRAADTTDPTIQISAPNSLGYVTTYGNYIYLIGYASDDVGVTSVTWYNARTGGSGTATGTDYWESGSIPLLVGLNNITVTAYDAAGNHGTDYIDATYVIYDILDPEIAIIQPTSDPSYSTHDLSASLSGTYSDNVGVTDITWSNAATSASGTATFSSGNWQIGPVTLQNGTNIITVTAYDAAGNWDAAVISIYNSPEDSTDTGGLSLEMILIILAIIVIILVIILYLLRRSRRGG